jgi:hypothetical protein
MKTIVFISMLFAFTFSKADISLDSLRESAFRPVMKKYLDEISALKSKIVQSDQRDSLRYFAKQIMKLSDDMERKIKFFHNYRASEMVFTQGYFFTPSGYNYGFGFVNIPGGKLPAAVSSVNRIYDLASHIRFICNGNPKKVKHKLEQIAKEQELLSLY